MGTQMTYSGVTSSGRAKNASALKHFWQIDQIVFKIIFYQGLFLFCLFVFLIVQSIYAVLVRPSCLDWLSIPGLDSHHCSIATRSWFSTKLNNELQVIRNTIFIVRMDTCMTWVLSTLQLFTFMQKNNNYRLFYM